MGNRAAPPNTAGPATLTEMRGAPEAVPSPLIFSLRKVMCKHHLDFDHPSNISHVQIGYKTEIFLCHSLI